MKPEPKTPAATVPSGGVNRTGQTTGQATDGNDKTVPVLSRTSKSVVVDFSVAAAAFAALSSYGLLQAQKNQRFFDEANAKEPLDMELDELKNSNENLLSLKEKTKAEMIRLKEKASNPQPPAITTEPAQLPRIEDTKETPIKTLAKAPIQRTKSKHFPY